MTNRQEPIRGKRRRPYSTRATLSAAGQRRVLAGRVDFLPRRADHRRMGRVALTLWFTITTLLGPGVCCCSFATAKPTAAGERPSAKPVKSCCDRHDSPCCPDGRKHREPGEPSKCPCEKGKQVTAVPPAATTTTDLSAQLKLFDALFVSLLSCSAFDLPAVDSVFADTSPPAVQPAGRELLAAYSLLRC